MKNKSMIIYSDNQSSIKLSGTDGYHSRTKHIDVRHHFIRDKVMGGTIEVRYIQTDMMVADALTKATTYSKLFFCSSKMGLCLRAYTTLNGFFISHDTPKILQQSF